jgi:hypothetical protein
MLDRLFSLFLEPSPATVERSEKGAIRAPTDEVAVLFHLRWPSGPQMRGGTAAL